MNFSLDSSVFELKVIPVTTSNQSSKSTCMTWPISSLGSSDKSIRVTHLKYGLLRAKNIFIICSTKHLLIMIFFPKLQ